MRHTDYTLRFSPFGMTEILLFCTSLVNNLPQAKYKKKKSFCQENYKPQRFILKPLRFIKAYLLIDDLH